MEPFLDSVILGMKNNKEKIAHIFVLSSWNISSNIWSFPTATYIFIFFLFFKENIIMFPPHTMIQVQINHFIVTKIISSILPLTHKKLKNIIKKWIADKWSTKSKMDKFFFRNKDIYFNSKFLKKFLFYATAKKIHDEFGSAIIFKLGE